MATHIDTARRATIMMKIAPNHHANDRCAQGEVAITLSVTRVGHCNLHYNSTVVSMARVSLLGANHPKAHTVFAWLDKIINCLFALALSSVKCYSPGPHLSTCWKCVYFFFIFVAPLLDWECKGYYLVSRWHAFILWQILWWLWDFKTLKTFYPWACVWKIWVNMIKS